MVHIRHDPTAGALPARLTHAVMGHFGELVQGRLGQDGPVVAITLPCPALAVRAAYRPGGSFRLRSAGPSPLDAARAVSLLRALDGGSAEGCLALSADMPPGGGAGSSTAAILATAIAYAASRRIDLHAPEQLARICVGIEGATDPLMFADPATLLWAPRIAEALGRLPPLPEIEVVGGFFGPGVRTDPTDVRFADVADLVAAWPSACASGNPRGIAALATASAERNAVLRGGPDIAHIGKIGKVFGALGIVAAHTGSALGLIFVPDHPGCGAAGKEMTAAGFEGVVRFRPDDTPQGAG